MTFQDQLRFARERINELKITTPEIFPEWQRLKLAEKQLTIATDEVNSAQLAWDRLGSDNN
jgi:hypothetical protein